MDAKLTPSHRSIWNVIRSATTPTHAGTLLQETGVSIYTLGDAIKRLTRSGLIVRIDSPDGPRYAQATPESEAR